MAKPRKVIRTKYLYRNSRRKKVRNTIFFLLLIVILVGIGYLVSQEWSKRFGEGAPSSTVPPISIPSEDSPVSSGETVSDTESSQPEEVPLQLQMKQIPVADMNQSREQLVEEFAQLRQAGYTAVCFDLKDAEGTIHYNTENGLAREYGTVSETPADLDVLVSAAREAGITPVARLTALRDNKAAHVDRENSYAYRTPDGPNWLDNSMDLGGKAWLNPYMENTRLYLSGLCREISQKGIPVILLEDVIFPEKNTRDLNEVNPFTTREAILTQLVEEIQTAAGEETVVYWGYDLAATALQTTETYPDYAARIGAFGYSHLAPQIDLAAVEGQKAALCQSAGIQPGEEGVSSVTAVEVVSQLLEQTLAAQEGKAEVLPLLAEGDVSALQPVFAQYDLTSYMIY